MEETEAPEAKQEAEKLRFTEPRSEWEFPQTLLTLILLILFPLYGEWNWGTESIYPTAPS